MNRNLFLRACLAAGAFLSAPFAALSQYNKRGRGDKAIKVKAGKDRFDKPISLFAGDRFYTKVSSKDTDGDVYVFESTRVKEGGPFLHLHPDQDEFWYVIKGEFLFKVGDETFTAKAGDTVFGPRKVSHAFAKVGKGEAKLLMFFQPAGKMEEAFQKVSEGVTQSMTPKQRDTFWEQHGVNRMGPALTYEKSTK